MSLWSQPASCTYWRAPTINLGILPRSFMPIMRVSMTYCPLHKTELLVDTIFLWCKWPEEMASLHDVDIAVVLLLLPPSLPRISHSIWTLSQWHNMSFHCSTWGQSLFVPSPSTISWWVACDKREQFNSGTLHTGGSYVADPLLILDW